MVRFALLIASAIATGLMCVGTVGASHPAPGPATSAEPAADTFDVVAFAKDVMIPMRDGVRLATDIYRPAANGAPIEDKLPVLLERTPYNKEAEGALRQARAFASHGYIVAVQDERGAYKSEGTQAKYSGYSRDGYDTIEWLSQLPYADGKVGMWGTSYSAHVQAGAAILRPPHLKTIVLNCGGLYNGWFYKMRNHGAFELAQQITWAFTQLAAQTRNPLIATMLKREKVEDWVGVIQGKRGLNPLSVAPNFEDYFFEMMTHADYDAYWKESERNWSLYYDETSDIPMLHITGWYDSYTGGTIRNYEGLSKIKKSSIKLLVGPWVHGANTRSWSGDVEFGTAAAITDFNEAFHLRWFDRFLKARDTGADRDPAVRLFVMGTGDGHKDQNGRMVHGGYWRTAASWPLPETTLTTYYFHSDGTLSIVSPPAAAAPTTYSFDPRHPVPTVGGSFTGSELGAAGGFDQREPKPPHLPLRARADVVVFQTAPLAEDVEVVGSVVVKLFAASSAADTDFTAKLVDVYPPSADYPSGYDLNVTDGIVRARYRNSPEHAELMKAGRVYGFEIEPFPTANVFKKGHQIRIDISSSNSPRFDVNQNTGGPLGRGGRMAIADNSIYHDAKHPSAVVLPIVPAAERQTTFITPPSR